MESKIIRLPAPLRNRFGLPAQFAITPDNGDAKHAVAFYTHLYADHFRGDRLIDKRDLGSGLVTHAGTLALANDWQWASPSAAAVNVLKLMNYHASGTGATAAAATDIQLQTLAAPTTTTAVTGTQTIIQPAALGTNAQQYQSVGLVSYTTTLAITEWGLHNAAALSATTGSPFTATSATTGTVTATPLTASSTTVQGSQQMIVKPATTTVWGMVFSNTTSVFTFRAATATNGGWYTVAAGAAGATPGATETYVILPVLWDHKVFSAINVVNGDSIQFTYQLTVQSGG
jgi:hypothetical protein